MKRERDPTPDEFEKLLLWLDPDREEAGRKLKVIHTRLSQIFVSRGCLDAESLADEVLNRVAVRIDNVRTNYPDPLRCCIGFVENVYREYLREQRKRADLIEPPASRPPDHNDEDDRQEREEECLRKCLETLPKQERELVERYFGGEKKIANRKKLAAELELSSNALRIQAHRARKKLLKCRQAGLKQD